ncbi:SDR family oxidoreductase [Micrococcus sp.]|uniref:SDR family oxidoreductase n=1 Tax=Micrococcus sp. TaxID=1271 RepID=UPI0026DC5345|nr:SDR family oxidoreductase [Micrococcus sp.]MDO4239670.1 SDR family oxidoreductase [Micrococcus sp.]
MNTLHGRTALVTGVSRRQGIGFAVARRLARAGASLRLTHYSAHDAQQPWGADHIDAVIAELRPELHPGASLEHTEANFGDPREPARVMDWAGPVEILVANHARSGGDGTLAQITPQMLEAHWRVDAQSVILLTQHFAHRFAGGPGRVVWMSSGQAEGPMPGEVAYAGAKAMLAGLVRTVADELVDQGILLNAVNPGPVNTGYLDEATTYRPEQLDAIRAAFPLGRLGEPDDPARLIEFLVSDAGAWVVGQTIASEGGFRRW